MKKLILPLMILVAMGCNTYCPECEHFMLTGHEAWCSEAFVDERTHEISEAELEDVVVAEVKEIEEPMDDDTDELRFVNKFKLSYYDCCPQCTDYYYIRKTASGTTPTAHRTIAADTSILPMGTHVYIDGLGEYVVEDTGSAINGYVLDVYVNNHSEIPSCGIEYRDVYVIERR